MMDCYNLKKVKNTPGYPDLVCENNLLSHLFSRQLGVFTVSVYAFLDFYQTLMKGIKDENIFIIYKVMKCRKFV